MTTVVSHEEFLALGSLSELYELYRSRGHQDLSDTELFAKAQAEWQELALAKASAVDSKPERFEPIVVERDGLRYEIYGLIHGLVGGDDKEYKSFVSQAIGKHDYLLFENGLNYFYAHKDSSTIPDFIVLGVSGSLGLGFQVGFSFIPLLYELLREIVKQLFAKPSEKSGDPLEFYDYDTRYHSLDPETRRGLCEDPPLPSRLQIELEMAAWDQGGLFSRLWNPFLIVPRSMYMAGYAVGHAKTKGLSTVPIVVGDLHATEIQRFLEDASLDHAVFQSGQRFGEKQGFGRSLSFAAAKLGHLLLAGLAGTIIIFTGLFIVLFVLHKLGIL